MSSSYDAAAKTYTLHCRQHTPPTNGQESKLPVLIPIRMGLLGPDGERRREAHACRGERNALGRVPLRRPALTGQHICLGPTTRYTTRYTTAMTPAHIWFATGIRYAHVACRMQALLPGLPPGRPAPAGVNVLLHTFSS